MSIRTRPATEADKPFLSWLEEACMREYAVALRGVWRPRPPDEQTPDGCRIIVEGDESIGCITTIAHPDHIWVDQLYISPGFQRLTSAVVVEIRWASEVAIGPAG
jgi:hypothetical protein